MNRKALWTCGGCGRAFANRNQSHSCGTVGDLGRHFEGKQPVVRATFERLLEEAEKLGPVTVLPEKTRIALQVRMSFAAFVPRHRWLDGHVVLDRRLESPRFRRIETYSPRNVLHAFRLSSPEEVDGEVSGWLARAYAVGEQRHLNPPTKQA
jgi:hypothetical protein